MIVAPLRNRTAIDANAVDAEFPPSAIDDHTLAEALKLVHQVVPPLWPLADYVAVNPCVGVTDQPFLSACQLFQSVRKCDLLPSKSHFQKLRKEGLLTNDQIAAAHARCVAEHAEWYQKFDLPRLFDWLRRPEADAASHGQRILTAAEALDRQRGSRWSSHIVNDITRHCSAHYDEGQAAWANPWKDAGLYTAWREASRLSRRMDMLGMKGFRAFVSRLPSDPRLAIQKLLEDLDVPASRAGQFLLASVFSVSGWASYVRYQVREAESVGHSNDDLVGLAAIRLAYDAALIHAAGFPALERCWPVDFPPEPSSLAPPDDLLARHLLQVAVERNYRESLLEVLSNEPAVEGPSSRKAFQIVFCIDVRSEVMRRNLESIDPGIETFGFAGFFGLPLELVELGGHGTPQCPVLLQPNFRVQEELRGIPAAQADDAVQSLSLQRLGRRLWKSVQGSAVPCFSFVESLGWPYLAKLLTDSFRWTRPASGATTGLPPQLQACLGPDIHSPHNHGLSADRRIDLAESMLRNLGLTSGFARVVALCGHASEVTNNPYRAALDCGACGGHSGEPNARVAAALLNDPAVRAGLAARGIEIPNDTWFLAAVHQTTTDRFQLFDLHQAPASHGRDLAQIQGWLNAAGELTRQERSLRLSTQPEELFQRSQDWAEVQPEWGLANNAAFIVAPRHLTAGRNLGGRTFLHSYDHRRDPEWKVLELILTAPMVVTNWINMQYYASAVDPAAFGSGNKLIHNVVGQVGVLEGNGGDLMTGLPRQSVFNGDELQHEPLRLTVIVAAPRHSIERILRDHAIVRNLATNGWVSLVAWEDGQFHRWTAESRWEPEQLAA